ncbi:hypothetical protein H8U31_001344 [Salmonella enterica]|nr:hypothetical protein [Salmonella enterica]EFO7976636.1 hypothetical protein [Salmonella enterica]EGC0267593.1 hypothetical protein [Salmonella enterica]
MKLIEQETLLKTVEYFGVMIEVTLDTNYLAASPRGTVTAWANCAPKAISAHNGGYWWSCDDNDFQGEVAVVDLEGMDWKQSCVEV